MAYTSSPLRHPSSYAELVSESRALLHEAKAEAIRERESVSTLDAKRCELERALDRSAEQRAATRLARQAARDMAYRVEATKQSAQKRRAEIRQKRLEDYQRELRDIHEERRQREADSERWWTDKLLGVLEEQVDTSCDDMARVRSEIGRTRDMLNREAENARVKRALAPRPSSATHVHHHHYPPKPPLSSASPIRRLPISPFAKFRKPNATYATPPPRSTRSHIHNHTHIHVGDGGDDISIVRHTPKSEGRHTRGSTNNDENGAHSLPVGAPFSQHGESDDESDILSPVDDLESDDDGDHSNGDDSGDEGDFPPVAPPPPRASNRPSTARRSRKGGVSEARACDTSRPSSARPSAKDRGARESDERFQEETHERRRHHRGEGSGGDEEEEEVGAEASQLEEKLASRHDVLGREREKLARIDEENERKTRSHCAHLLRAIKHTNAEIKGIRSDQHRVLAKERARSRKLERQLKRLEISYKRIQAARPRHSWVPSGYGTT